jgi:Mg2+-importing ATPase
MNPKIQEKLEPTNLETGLSSIEAVRRLRQYGPNEFSEDKKFNGLREVARLLLNPLNLILIFASFVSGVLHEKVDAMIIIVMVISGTFINFLQSYRSEKLVRKLKEAVAPKANVLRDGRLQEIARIDLVPGDVIELSAGNLVPADATLLVARDLHVQEAALTGESFPVEKSAGPPGAQSTIYLGSSIVSGTARALVVATGGATKFGGIAERLSSAPPETEFDRGTRQFGFLILKTVFVLVIFVLVVNVLRHREIFDSLLFAVALAVGLTPEFLPVITAVTLTKGAREMAKANVIVKHLSAMQNFGSIDVLCSDKTGTITSGQMKLHQILGPLGDASDDVFEFAYANSAFQSGVPTPLDQAILSYKVLDLGRIEKMDEIPFDFERRRVSVVAKKQGQEWLIVKGAPESLLKVSTHYLLGSEKKAIDTAAFELIEKKYQTWHAQGFRVLAVASRPLETFKNGFSKEDEADLVLNGFLTFSDPLLPNVKEAIQKLQADGVVVKILTGDNELVAKYICSEAGLDSAAIIDGKDIEALDDLALEHIAETTTVFARVTPSQKTRILLALKARKHVVGFMGDGVNDAPSLHAADIGISFSTAVDIAKEASDIILLERNLLVLHDGIIQGRMAFGNMMKYLLMGTSSNFGNMFSMAAASILLPFLPMLPVQILLNNFLYDLAQISIPADRVDPTYIVKPRHWDISLIRKFMLSIGPISSIFDFITFYLLLRMFDSSAELFHTGWFLESLMTQTLVIFSIRTTGNAFQSRPSWILSASVIGVLLLGLSIPYFPFAADLGFRPLPPQFYGALALLTVAYLGIVEFVKRKLMDPRLRTGSR